MRLIDANDVKRRGDCYPSDVRKVISNVLSHTKTVKDAVVVVRCKECKHYYYADNRIPQEQRFVCDLDGDRWKPDSFCSFAERRDNDE